MKKYFFLIFCVLAFVGGLILSPYVRRFFQNQSVPVGVQPPQTIFLPQISDRNINEETDRLTIDVTYPRINDLANSGVEEEINALLGEKVLGYILDFKENSEEGEPFEEMKSSLIIDYDVVLLTSEKISIRLNYSEYSAGAAHPNNFVRGFNFDIKKNKPIFLHDLFEEGNSYLETLSTISRKKATEQIKEIDPDWLRQGTEPKKENFSEFVLEDNVLVLLFNPYQIAPYALGVIEVKIPFAELNTILKK